MATTFSKGCGALMFLLFAMLQIVGMSSALAQDSLCAEVKIEIKQKLSLERQAFDAHMRITNGLDTSAIENVGAVLHFEDDKGNEVIATSDPNNTSAAFFARIDSLSGIDSIEGGGRVNPKTTADIHWLIIPAQGTGGTEPGGKLYYIGATLTYTLAGQASTVEVTPDYVTVKPQPLLDLDYFLAGDVYADDPFTPETEPPIPFTLGVRINNVGAGPANKVTIESAQPKIVENKQGLLIDFKILDSYVSDQPAGKTLLIDFGDIAPKTSKVGRWNMVTTLSGKFVEINASYTHADSLGGALTSLIRNINSYLLVHDVKVDLPGRDNIRDFLAKNGDVLRVYESDGGDFPVTDQSKNASLQSNGGTHQITFPSTTGFAYARMTDPFAGKRSPTGLIRSDNKILPPENIWLSQIRDENNNWQYFINIFDANTTGRYSLNFVSGTTGDIGGIVYYDANSNGQQDEGEPGLGNVKVTLQGTDNEGAGVSTTAYTMAEGVYKFVSLKPGTYRLKVDAVDGYLDGVRTIGSAGGTLSVEEENLISDIMLTAGVNASGYGFAKRKPSAATEEADLAIAMMADKAVVRADDEVVLTLTASNAGPAAATGVTVTDLLPQELSLVTATPSSGAYDPVTGLWNIGALGKGASATLTLKVKVGAIGESVTNKATIASSLLDPNTANNTAQVTLTKEGDLFTLSQYVPKEARILVLASCPLESGEDDAACAEAKASWSVAYLSAQGYVAQVATDTEAFRQSMRSGKYNTYWINGGAAKLTAPLADEIRIAVRRGDTLIIDGTRDAQSSTFDAVTGTAPGASLENGMVAVIDGANVSVAGHPVALTLQGATALARFDDAMNSAAVTRHVYGQGTALSAGFDLIGTLRTPAVEQAIRTFLMEALHDATPAVPETVVGNAYVPIVAEVTHNGKEATTATVSMALPSGVTFIEAHPAPSAVTNDRITWTLAMAAEDRQSLRLGVRVPTQSTTLRLTTGIADTHPAVTADLDIDVKHFDAANIADVVGQVSAPEVAVNALAAAQTAFTSAAYETAIDEVVKADLALAAGTTQTLRQELAQWLQETEMLWQKTPPVPAVPASIVAVGGTPQATVVNTAFAEILQAKVLDAEGAPVVGVIVTFRLPTNEASANGASAVFAGGGAFADSASAMVTTDVQGLASTPILKANGTAGSYAATVTANGVTEPASFALTNQASMPVPASIAATGGTPQSATVNTVFAQTLQTTVLDASSQPVPNATVTFTLPSSGASATFAGGGITATATTDAQGVAISPALAANATVGSYQAQAAVTGVATKAVFDLTNTVAAQIPAAILATGGAPQSATVDTTFAQALQATVRDASDQPVAGVTVTFTLPVSGASATFAGGSATATATTNAQGIATSPVLTANGTVGDYQAQASVVGVAATASFALSNTATQGSGDEPASIVALNDAAQVATVNTVFAHPLQARVLAADNQPVAGALVTFALPDSGASATFANGQKSVTVATDAQGVAASPVFTASATVGSYQAQAAVDGVATAATFALINSAIPDGNHSTAAALLVLSGSPQIAMVDTTFTQPLQVMALDAENRPVPDLEVTFTLPGSGASARFAGDVLSVIVKTDAQGVAMSPKLTANATAGHFTATAIAGALQADFALANSETQKVPDRVIAAAGTPQTAMVNTAFGEVLKAWVLDANLQPLSGVAVTFTLPASGASATFPGGAAMITVATDENGLAVTPPLVANGTVGGYQSIATVEGIAQSAAFALANSAAPIVTGDTPASIAAIGGMLQTATTGTAFAQTLLAQVLDADNRPVANAMVTFTLPTAGASAAFIGAAGSTMTAMTNASGIAVSPALVANATVGSYTVTAQVGGVAIAASFSLSNETAVVTPIAGSIAVDSGTPQNTIVNTAFGQPLKVLVKDTGGTPMAGVAVTFALPASGASALFDNGRNTLIVLTDENGIASSRTVTANGLEGSYSATANVAGVAIAANFNLTNDAAPVIPVAGSIVASGGTPQSAEVNTVFGEPLKVLVKDTNDAPMADVEVTFALPASGASASFAGSGTTATATTDVQGIAISPTLTANATTGSYQAQASVVGVAAKANFVLSNTAEAPVVAAINATGGTPQSTTVNTAFAQPLHATVLDGLGQPMANVTVTFTLPSSGASATFAGGGATATAATNAQGIATSPALAANATAGNYQAQASVAGLAAKALFDLTNTAASGHTAPTFSGTSATGTGTVSASVSGGGPNCAFDLDRTKMAKPSGVMMNLLGKYLMPHGVFEFVLVGCNVGSTVTVTTSWPSIKGMTGYMKYGPTPWLPWVSTWYVPNNLKISGNSVSYTITDGGLGDDDLTKNGVIRDPGGPVVLLSSGEPIPALSGSTQALLLLLMVFAAAFGYRRMGRG